MHEQELERILKSIGREQFTPDPDLVLRTKHAIHQSRFLPAMVLISLGLQLLTGVFALYVLCSPDIGWTTKAYGFFGFSILLTVFLLPLFGIRDQLQGYVAHLREAHA
jgi:hypothetical protein